jgi:ASC-1-like (ASCH) protein
MKTHLMNLNPTAFEKVKSGNKTIETRLYDDKRRLINIGDVVTFWCNEDKVNVVVTDLLKYKGFEDLFSNNDFSLFGGDSLESLMTIYKYYSRKDEEKFGVVGIKFTSAREALNGYTKNSQTNLTGQGSWEVLSRLGAPLVRSFQLPIASSLYRYRQSL